MSAEENNYEKGHRFKMQTFTGQHMFQENLDGIIATNQTARLDCKEAVESEVPYQLQNGKDKGQVKKEGTLGPEIPKKQDRIKQPIKREGTQEYQLYQKGLKMRDEYPQSRLKSKINFLLTNFGEQGEKSSVSYYSQHSDSISELSQSIQSYQSYRDNKTFRITQNSKEDPSRIAKQNKKLCNERRYLFYEPSQQPQDQSKQNYESQVQVKKSEKKESQKAKHQIIFAQRASHSQIQQQSIKKQDQRGTKLQIMLQQSQNKPNVDTNKKGIDQMKSFEEIQLLLEQKKLQSVNQKQQVAEYIMESSNKAEIFYDPLSLKEFIASKDNNEIINVKQTDHIDQNRYQNQQAPRCDQSIESIRLVQNQFAKKNPSKELDSALIELVTKEIKPKTPSQTSQPRSPIHRLNTSDLPLELKPQNKIQFKINTNLMTGARLQQRPEEEKQKMLKFLKKRQEALAKKVRQQLKLTPKLIQRQNHEVLSKPSSALSSQKIEISSPIRLNNKAGSIKQYTYSDRFSNKSLNHSQHYHLEKPYYPTETLKLSKNYQGQRANNTFYLARGLNIQNSESKFKNAHSLHSRVSSERELRSLSKKESVQDIRRSDFGINNNNPVLAPRNKISYYNLNKFQREQKKLMNSKLPNPKEKYERLKQLLEKM